MKKPRWFFPLLAAVSVLVSAPAIAQLTAVDRIPATLKPWESWATWSDEALRQSPTSYADAKTPLTFWPSELRISAAASGAMFRQTVTVYSPSWVALPGGELLWPSGVTVGGKPVAVLGQGGRPVVRLPAGPQEISGALEWKAMPQNIALPPETGIVLLEVEGQRVDAPLWDEEGRLWLKRGASPEEAAGPDFLSINLYAALEDGIPLWLRTRVELIVSGQSREEDLGTILPEGWSVAAVDSPIPVAVDANGRAKAQVRAGRWTINVSAFRLDDVRELRFASGATPAADSVLIGFQAKPDFRIVELAGVSPVDVTMTTFPDDWRNLPVYQWPSGDVLRIEERLRGMGEQAPEGLRITRTIWLDENGRSMTFRDNIRGTRQKIWRLDAASGQELGSVRSDGVGQLITRDPADGAPGVEIRSRNLSLEAAGRMAVAPALSATGWNAEADNLDVTLNLPPGWRLFALFGADWVQGDWLTSWSLLDLFVVMIFTLAVFRLRGAGAALLAFVALALSYRESGAPQMLWLALLAPIAIMTVVPSGRLRMLVAVWKWATVAIFILAVVPFLSAQIQQAIYPQLERVPDAFFAPRPAPAGAMLDESAVMPAAAPQEAEASQDSYGLLRSKSAANVVQQQVRSQNMAYEAKARIQTGPGVPEWTWRGVRFGWNGPVTAGQTFRPVLISAGLERMLTILRLVLVLALLSVLLGLRRGTLPGKSVPAAAALMLSVLLFSPATVSAQFPDAAMLKTLRERLIEKNDLPAETAAIPQVSLTLTDRSIVMESEIHAATLTAVPLPGRLPAWSPVSVMVDGKPGAAVRRDDNYLWVALPAGVHSVRVEGLLGDVSQWEWTFQLRPHRVKVEAPGWNVSGINPDGVPEQQVFFSRQQKAVSEEAAYDRQDFQTVALVERELELGLIWQVRTTVRRLTAPGKALALRVPLLPGEKVLSANIPIKDGAAEVRLPAGEEAVSWQSELTSSDKLALATRADDTWVEQWRLIASPVWNVTFGGTAPVFEEGASELVPVWRPWPGEAAELVIGRPEPVPGATVTVHRAKHAVSLGDRQRTSTLELALTSSLGEDFLVGLPAGAQITALSLDGKDLPARMDGDRVVVPLRPGEQNLSIGWRTSVPLTTRAQVDTVTLPVESANIETTVGVPANRWVLWTDGPQRGPAVRFWTVLAFSLVAALFLGRLKGSPLSTPEWMLLAIGLTQVPLPAALVVVGWLFLLVWRGRPLFQNLTPAWFNLGQALMVISTVGALSVLVSAVAAGLLGSPEMFIAGNGSTAGSLIWYIDRAADALPSPSVQSVSVWWYRLAMLVWAIWLATATLRWLVRGWTAFTTGGAFRSMGRKSTPPAVPPAKP
jgi:hypothetical protein